PCTPATRQPTLTAPRISRPRPDLQTLLAWAFDLTHTVTHPTIYGGSRTGKPEIGAM
ncbi:amidase, partial [Pseudomonas syringae]|nr:amidase [Pseudomonas syringae]